MKQLKYYILGTTQNHTHFLFFLLIKDKDVPDIFLKYTER